jgi:hypothetical protein
MCLYYDCQGKDDDIEYPIVVPANFARKLERERNAALDALDKIESHYVDGDDTYEAWKAMGEIAATFLAENAEPIHPESKPSTPEQPANEGLDETTCSGFFIVNRYDRPSEDHVAERRKDGYMYYVHPKLRNEKRYWAMNPDDPTPLEDFGIRILIEGGKLHGKLVDPSRATYLDGRVRKWQGDVEFFFDYPNAIAQAPIPAPKDL